MLGWIQIVSLQVDTTQFLKFKLKYLPDIKKRWNQVSYYLDLTINCPSVSLPLKQRSKISVRCRSQEYFFGKYSATIEISVVEFISSKIPCVQHILLETFILMCLKVWKLFFETHLILDIQTTFSLQKPHCKNLW